jgi:hypothetical protein
MSSSVESSLRWTAVRAIGLVWAVREALALWRVRGARRTSRLPHTVTK